MTRLRPMRLRHPDLSSVERKVLGEYPCVTGGRVLPTLPSREDPVLRSGNDNDGTDRDTTAESWWSRLGGSELR